MSFKTGFTEQLGRIAAATVVEIATKVVHNLVVKPASNESRDHNLSDEEYLNNYTRRYPELEAMDIFYAFVDQVAGTPGAHRHMKFNEMVDLLDEEMSNWEEELSEANEARKSETAEKVFGTGAHYYAYVNSRVPHIDNLDLFEELFDEVTETKKARYILDLKYSEMIKILDEKCPEWETILDEKIADRETLESEGHLDNNPIDKETLDSFNRIFEKYYEKPAENNEEDK